MVKFIRSYRVAIRTKYYGPTNTKGSRIKAMAEAGKHIGETTSVFTTYDCALDSYDNHERAAKRLCEKLEWEGTFTSGSLNNDGGMVFVYLNK